MTLEDFVVPESKLQKQTNKNTKNKINEKQQLDWHICMYVMGLMSKEQRNPPARVLKGQSCNNLSNTISNKSIES